MSVVSGPSTVPGSSAFPAIASASIPAPTLGVLGLGRVGGAVLRTALRAGYAVNVAARSHPVEIEARLDAMFGASTSERARVRAVATDDLAEAGLVVLALPLDAAWSVDPVPFTGRTLVDVMNHWAPPSQDVERGVTTPRRTGTSEDVQRHFAGARVVKTLNHIAGAHIERDSRPVSSSLVVGSESAGMEPARTGPTGRVFAERRAQAVAGDDPRARDVVAALLDRLGFDAVDAGPLAAGRVFEPGTPVFDGVHDRDTLAALVARELAAHPSLRDIRGRTHHGFHSAGALHAVGA
ncbi:NADPH-dependent F420 reductase [Brevibacterium litoralis]|uniref:NADPH-dependent F420 reductase n=1 Tax=Brevibacterium litoralis TaxID=3138935 RepID=UPI0032ED46A1